MGQFIKVAKVSEISPGNGKQIDAGVVINEINYPRGN